MKIIHILKGKANPNTLNGVNKVVHNLATEQLILGGNVEVWGITSSPEIVRHKHDYPLKLYPATRNRFFLSSRLRSALGALPKDSIAHLHSVFLPELYAVGMFLNKISIPYVLTPHGGYAPESRNKNRIVKSIYMVFFERPLALKARKLHAIGASEVDDCNHLFPPKPVVLIPNGQNFNEVLFQHVETLKPKSRPVFGYCGRLSKNHKGLDLLIKGFALYKQAGGRGELWLVGDGPDKVLLKKLAKKERVADVIKFLGPMFDDKKLSYLAEMDLFVHTSRWDGLPMAALEAAALGKPLLVSRETNLYDYVKGYGNGFILSKNTPETIAELMQKFKHQFQNSNLIELGRKSTELVRNEFEWKRIAQKMIRELYQTER